MEDSGSPRETTGVVESSPSCPTCRKIEEGAVAYLEQLSQVPEVVEPGQCPRRSFREWTLTGPDSKNATSKDASECKAHREFLKYMEPADSIYLTSGKSLRLYRAKTREDEQTWFDRFTDLVVIPDATREGVEGVGVGRKIDRNFVDFGLVQHWKSYCEKHHGPQCSPAQLPLLLPLAWLIDTQRKCLVPASDENTAWLYPYVALSYVWGRLPTLKLTKSNLSLLQEEGSLGADKYGGKLPPTIRDAISLAPLLGERYLWVDLLCIVQDDQEMLQAYATEIATICENAVLTIVAGDGDDASHGIHGIRGVSQPRHLNVVLSLPNGVGVAMRQMKRLSERAWSKQGSKLQESIFSRRRLDFVDGSIRWSCQANAYFEEINSPLDQDRQWSKVINTSESLSEHMCLANLSLDKPDIRKFFELVDEYTGRDLSFDEDVLLAFQSTLRALQRRAFPRGFVCGLPVSFLDVALLWTAFPPFGGLRRRRPTDPSCLTPPTWSWAAWQGTLYSSRMSCQTYIKTPVEVEGYPHYLPFQVIPMLTWHLRTSTDLAEEPISIPYQNDWYTWKHQHMGAKENLPDGWLFHDEPNEQVQAHVESLRRLVGGEYPFFQEQDPTQPLRFEDVVTRYHYTHQSVPDVKFWHPVPLGDKLPPASDTEQRLDRPAMGRLSHAYLCAETQQATLWAARPRPNKTFQRFANLRYYQELVPMFGTALCANTVLRDGPGPEAREVGQISIDRWADGKAISGGRWLGDDGYDHRLGRVEYTEEDGEEVDVSHVDEVNSDESPGTAPVISCNLVAISRGFDFPQPMVPAEESYSFYNVLWVKWENGVAYRRGVGRVEKAAWEELRKKDVYLVLG